MLPACRAPISSIPAVQLNAVWVSITPFGLEGPVCALARLLDLGVMAASANMYCTGDPVAVPVRCTEPTGYADTGPEAAFATLTALWTGVPQRVHAILMQEVGAGTRKHGDPGPLPADGVSWFEARRLTSARPAEIWPTTDGFVSFGLRGGKALCPESRADLEAGRIAAA